tara:strand:+ start:213110 stop:213871 length:762 start_codon:yes stop_codon:yes gene_type:complete
VVIPVYNESSCIEKVALEWKSALRFQKASFQIIFVNDGSTDNTLEILENLCSENEEMEVLNQVNGGHGSALLTGYHHALTLNSEYVFQVDSDDQFLPSDFSKLWKMREAAPFILGIRTKRHDPLSRIFITKFLKMSLRIIFGTKISDANIPYRLIQKDFLSSIIHCLPAGIFAPNVFISVLASKYLGNLPQVPVTHIERATGQVSLIRLGLIKACIRSFFELIKFSALLDYKVSRMKLELNQTNNDELKRLHA